VTADQTVKSLILEDDGVLTTDKAICRLREISMRWSSATTKGDKPIYVGRTRNGFTPTTREQVFKRFSGLEIAYCPFANLPETQGGRWGAGFTAAKMKDCHNVECRTMPHRALQRCHSLCSGSLCSA
jgi:hypothetical protein